MGSRKLEVGLVLAIVAIVVVMVFRALSDSDDNKAVAPSEVRQALHELPYSFKFRPGGPRDDAVSVVAGTAYGPGGAVVHFGAAFGSSSDSVQLPGEGTAKAVRLDEGVITTREGHVGKRPNRSGNPKAVRAEQQHQNQMAAQISEKLCEAAGEASCPGASDDEGGGQIPPSGEPEPAFRTIDQGPLRK